MATWNTIGTGDGSVTSIDNAYGITVNPDPITTTGTVGLDLTAVTERAACRVISVSNLTATYSNGSSGVGATLTNSGTLAALTIDGVALSIGDRVLVASQTGNAQQHGIYSVTTVGSGAVAWVLTRTTDFDGSITGSIARGVTIWVSEGTLNPRTVWMQTAAGPFTMGTTFINFVGYTGQTTLITTGIITTGTWNGTTIAVANGGTGATSLTNHGILIGHGTSAVTSSVLTNGQLLIGSTGNDPTAAALTAGTGIAITNGAGSITVAVNNLPVSAGGTGFTSTTPYGLIIGGTTSTGALQNAGTGSAYEVFVSNGSSAMGFWTSILQNIDGLDFNGGIQIGNALAPNDNTIITGSSNLPIVLDPHGVGWVEIDFSGSKTGLQFNNQAQNRVITLWESANNVHEYYGFGINSGVLRYQVDATTSQHGFYTAASSSSSNELFRIKGNGDVLVINGTFWPSRLPSGWMYMEANGTATTITSNATFYKAAGTSTSGSLNQFTMPANNKLLYSGTPTISANVNVTASVSQNQALGSQVTIAVFKNGTRVTGTNGAATYGMLAQYLSITTNCIVSLATNDYIEVYVNGSVNGQTVTTANMQVTVSAT